MDQSTQGGASRGGDPGAPYCLRCGAATQRRVPQHDNRERDVCPACGYVHYAGPQLLVMTVVFAESRLLLLRRGQDPYRGMLAIPGGFVEPGESLEQAALRETEEEVGLVLDRTDLVPFANMSVPSINQVYVVFIARLPARVPLRPAMPEVIEAGWYLRNEVPIAELWGPADEFDIDLVFGCGCSERFDFYQRTDHSMRLISAERWTRQVWPD
jgi:ADP-ribose pyrophosphatase YjhB (NUDIX family)